MLLERRHGGGRWIRTTEGVSQQIYSLPPLAAWVSLRCCLSEPVKQPAILTRAARPVNAPRASGSDVEAEMEDVALLDPVLLAFQPQPPRFPGAGFPAVADEVVVADGLGADEALLEVGVDHRRGLRR